MPVGYQERHHDYVIGPNQDKRLASVAPGQVIEKIQFVLDPDAPFQLRSRALWCQYNNANSVTQTDLNYVYSRWTGPATDYRFQDFVAEAVQMKNFGQYGVPKPVQPIDYPANGTLVLDVANVSTTVTIKNLTFLFRGVKIFPLGVVPGYTYPAKFASTSYVYQIEVANMGVTERRGPLFFTVKPDADFVLRAGQFTSDAGIGPPGPNFFFQLMDFNKKPYSNDMVRADVLFGTGNSGAIYPSNPNTGPGLPGLFYPEIYVPANHQLVYNVFRDDSVITGAAAENLFIALIGAKVFPQ